MIMDSNLVTAIVSASGATLVAVASLLLNNKRFEDIGKRFDDVGKRFDDVHKRLDDMNQNMNKRFDDVNKRLERTDRRLELIEQDLKEFYKTQGEQATDIARLKDKTGLQ